ncbi:hypothetical protein [Sinorhizobium fredii]|uniref:hypothetical protein n=1 Tax=Rhizobium fredii TaxID=380 RepID=UPI00210BB35F|nr:hypothetical protein [Sinorhizobium fredii]UTY50447.1 hypothetical protein EPK84_28685 [Sinorhizobium fredii]
MNIIDEIYTIERRLRLARIPLQELYRAAGINGSTWTRWRTNKTSPRLTTWTDVQRAAEKVIIEKASRAAEQQIGGNDSHARRGSTRFGAEP